MAKRRSKFVAGGMLPEGISGREGSLEIGEEGIVGRYVFPIGYARCEFRQFVHFPVNRWIIFGIALNHQVFDADSDRNRRKKRFAGLGKRRSQREEPSDGQHLADIVSGVVEDVLVQAFSRCEFEQDCRILRIEERRRTTMVEDMAKQFRKRLVGKLLFRFPDRFRI